MDDLCCICMKSDFCLSEISSCPEDNLSYLEKLKFCITQVEWRDTFKLCKFCAVKINDAYDFCLLCIQNEKLREELASKVSQRNKVKIAVSPNETHLLPTELYNEPLHIKEEESQIHKENAQDENKETAQEGITETTEVVYNNRDSDFETDDKNSISKLSIEADNIAEEYPEAKISNQCSSKKKTKLKKPIKCSYCGRVFKRREHMSAHIRAIHTLEKPYACDICGTSFSVSQSLLIHKRRHNKEKPYCCTYCGKQFPCSSDLYHHNQIHLNKRQYKCDTCDKSFNTASILRRHKICAHTCPLMWKYVCIHCDRRFPMSGNLKLHLRRHYNEKNFTCEICSNSFYDKFILQRHMRSHTDERLFKCDICQKEYKDNCSLNIHLKKIHDIGNTVIPKRTKNFVCHICPKAFASDDKLKKHINSHSGTKPFECSHCDKSFTDNWYRKKHLEKKHNVVEA